MVVVSDSDKPQRLAVLPARVGLDVVEGIRDEAKDRRTTPSKLVHKILRDWLETAREEKKS